MVDTNEIWSRRIKAANSYYEEWENRFKCKLLEDYYEGFHWKNVPQGANPYTINFFYSTIKIKIANFLFAKPHFLVTPTPTNSDYDLEFAIASAQKKQDTLNAIINDPKINFKSEIELAFLDSIFRFGIIEVGYAADWVQNPNAGKPLFLSDIKESVDESEDKDVTSGHSNLDWNDIWIENSLPEAIKIVLVKDGKSKEIIAPVMVMY